MVLCKFYAMCSEVTNITDIQQLHKLQLAQ